MANCYISTAGGRFLILGAAEFQGSPHDRAHPAPSPSRGDRSTSPVAGKGEATGEHSPPPAPQVVHQYLKQAGMHTSAATLANEAVCHTALTPGLPDGSPGVRHGRCVRATWRCADRGQDEEGFRGADGPEAGIRQEFFLIKARDSSHPPGGGGTNTWVWVLGVNFGVKNVFNRKTPLGGGRHPLA